MKDCRSWGVVLRGAVTGPSIPERASPIGTNSPRLRCMVYSPMCLRQDHRKRALGEVHSPHLPQSGRHRSAPPDLSENDNQIRRSAAKGILGDLDRDGVVDEWDVKILVWYLMGDLFWKSYYDFELVDIDGDDDVDWTDLALLGSYVFTKPAPSNLYGIGEAVDAEEYLLSASLMPDPTKVDFKADGRWHNFTVTTSWKTQSQPPKHVDYTGPVTVRVDDSSILKMWWWQSSYYTCSSSLRDTDTAYNGQKVHFLACKEGAVTIHPRRPPRPRSGALRGRGRAPQSTGGNRGNGLRHRAHIRSQHLHPGAERPFPPIRRKVGERHYPGISPTSAITAPFPSIPGC